MAKMSTSSTTGASAVVANVANVVTSTAAINNSRNNRVIVPNHDNNHHHQLQSIIDRLADVYRSDTKKMCYDEDDEDHGICDSLEILDDDEEDDLNCDIKISENCIVKSDINPVKSNLNEKEEEGDCDEFDTNFDDNTSDLTSSPPPPVSPSKSSSPCHSSLNPITETITKTITFSSASSNDTCSATSLSSLQSSYTSASVASIASLSSSSSTVTTTLTNAAIRIQPPNMLSTMIQHFGGINNKHSSSSSSPATTTTPPPPPQSSLHPSSEQTLTSNSLPQSLTSSSSSSSPQPIIPVPPPFPSCFHNDLISDADGPTLSNNSHHQQLMYQPSVSSIRDAVSHLTRLDDFNVVKLSQGFFSQVFKVIHFQTKKTMVLKMNKEVGNRGNALKEIELLNKLNHPNIVAYMGTVVHEGALHPLLEYINGGTLEQLIKQFYTNESLHLMDGSSSSPSTSSSSSLDQLSLNSLSEPIPQFTAANIPIRNGIVSPKIHLLQNSDRTFTKLMRDVARGMDYLHSSGYLHRDLASKNVFIRKLPVRARSRDLNNNNNNNNNQRIQKEDPTSKRNCQIDAYLEDYFDDDRMMAVIGDFGFATTEPSPDQKLSTVGSPYWLAPECFKNQWYNHKCDIYSFGVMCCELNWCVPADPDYLPRMSHNFVVDFDQLHTRKDTLLASVAQLSCQIDPNHRPEFSELIRLFDSKLSEVDHYDYIDSDDHEQDIGSRGLDQPPQPQTPAYNRSQFVFRRGNSLDSSLYSGWFNNKAHGDVFEQHLLRRRLSAVYNRCSSIYNHHNHHNHHHLEPRRLNHSKSSNCS